MSLFKKKKSGNIRERVSTFEEEEDDAEPGVIESTNGNSKHPKKEKKNKAIKKLPVNALSFEDELEGDDGIIFQEKKSNLSYKLRREMKKEKKGKKKKNSSGVGEDRKSGLSELSEMGIKIVNGREAEAIAHQPGDSDGDEEDVDESLHQFNKSESSRSAAHRLTASSKASIDAQLNPLKDILQSGQIPDANTIHFIRKQRQQARERRDYVPVESSQREEPTGKSRLVREEDTDRDDDDGTVGGGGRLHFSDISNTTSASLAEAKALVASTKRLGLEEDDVAWEAQQIAKASGLANKIPDMTIDDDKDTQGQSVNEVSTTSAIQLLSSRPGVNYQAEGIMKRLRDSRDSLYEVHRRHEQELLSLKEERSECEDAVLNCDDTEHEKDEILKLYQTLSGYINDLRDCLNEKVMTLEDLEKRALALYSQRTDKLMARRRQDVTDQNDEVSPFTNESLKQCPVRNRRCAEREGRRTRRRREREKRGVGAEHRDGTSTDDEVSTQEIQQYSTSLTALEKEAEELFDDVEEEFGSLEKVLQQFERWRLLAPNSYADAYAANNMPKIVEVFIRKQLLLWNPLNEGVEVERMHWFTQLAMYAAPPASNYLTLQELALDPDKHLVSYTIEKVIFPKLRDVTKAYWDPLSHSQTVRLVNLVRHFCMSCPTIGPQSKQLQELCQAIKLKLKMSIDKDVFIPIFNKTAYESRTSNSSLFFQRQFWVTWKLLSQVLMWHNILSEDTLAELGVKGILNLYLLPALNIASDVSLKDGLEKAKFVIQALPREWAKSESDGSAHHHLSRLEQFLTNLAQKHSDLTQSHEQLEEICNLLRSIGASRAADVIIAKYINDSS